MSSTLADVENEYAKNKNLRKEDIRALREWADKQPHLPKISELQYILFLQSCYFSIEMTKATIDTFFTVKTLCPEFFANRDPTDAKFAEHLNVGAYIPLPKTTPEGYRVIFCKVMDSDASKYSFNEQIKNFDMSIMLWMMMEGTAEGLLIVMDMDGITFAHMTKLNVMGLKKFFLYLQEAMPVRLKGLHFINVVPFMDKFMALIKPFMKKELLSVLHLHTDSLDSLHKYVPQDCLPSNFGGKAAPIVQLHEQVKTKLCQNADFFKMDEKQLVDESKRMGKPKSANDIFGTEGSFKKLDID
ncbi:hypothetical protein RN001_011347 [Aquatica leii]|uniref:CRAL-TRIO domain-containing protein n=1 Tax=Aquatica leii TaxID=1421715 RepID=A0AAN7PBW0_9COLE|nr:hypothetical protein RN001_011347 [Aquatica leii]